MHSNTLHASSPNLSDNWRRNIIVRAELSVLYTDYRLSTIKLQANEWRIDGRLASALSHSLHVLTAF
jgi:hypothetical protein